MSNNNKSAIGVSARDSNIELLRILATCGVIVLHYNNPLFGGAIETASGINRAFLLFSECLSICAVNVFVMISGYFLCKSSKRTLLRPIELILQVMLIKEALYLVLVLLGRAPLTGKDVIANLIPNNWFVILYVTLYLISPFLNMVVDTVKAHKLEKRCII